MRLALTYLNKGGGIAQCTYELARVLSVKCDVTCYLAAQNPILDAFRKLPCRVSSFEMRRGWASLILAMLTRRERSGIAEAIIEDRPDIVLDTGSWWWGAVVQRQLGGRFAIAQMIHDVTPHPGPAAVPYLLHRRLYPPPADVVISLSEYVHRDLVRVYPRKAHIMSRHGVILPAGPADSEAVAARRRQFLFFGRIDRYKGLDVLVKAFGAAKLRDPEITLEIVGSGKIGATLRSEIERSGIALTNRWVSEEESAAAVARCGVIVLPYTSATQSGVAAAALANGIPCIATSVGALPEQVVDGRNGLIVPPRDARALEEAMLRIASDGNLARGMSAEAVRMAKDEYSWENIGSRLLEDLQSFLAGRGLRPPSRA